MAELQPISEAPLVVPLELPLDVPLDVPLQLSPSMNDIIERMFDDNPTSPDESARAFENTWDAKFSTEELRQLIQQQQQQQLYVVDASNQDFANTPNPNEVTPGPTANQNYAPSSTPNPIYPSCSTPYSTCPTPAPFCYPSTTMTPIPAKPPVKVPGLKPYRGEFGFEIDLDCLSDGRQTKSMNYTFSCRLKKLFCRQSCAVPIKYRADVPPPANSIVRALAIYEMPDHQHCVVERCPNDIQRASSDGNQSRGADYFVNMDDHNSVYDSPDSHGRHSVYVPFSAPPPGSKFAEVHVRFMCLSTCTRPSIGRRAVRVLFTLESPPGEVLGRDTVLLQVCSCPGRDRKKAEQQLDEQEPRAPQGKRQLPKKPSAAVTSIKKFVKKPQGAQPLSHATTSDDEENDDEDDVLRYIPVIGRKKYEELLKHKGLLDLKYGVDEETARKVREQAAVAESAHRPADPANPAEEAPGNRRPLPKKSRRSGSHLTEPLRLL